MRARVAEDRIARLAHLRLQPRLEGSGEREDTGHSAHGRDEGAFVAQRTCHHFDTTSGQFARSSTVRITYHHPDPGPTAQQRVRHSPALTAGCRQYQYRCVDHRSLLFSVGACAARQRTHGHDQLRTTASAARTPRRTGKVRCQACDVRRQSYNPSAASGRDGTSHAGLHAVGADAELTASGLLVVRMTASR